MRASFWSAPPRLHAIARTLVLTVFVATASLGLGSDAALAHGPSAAQASGPGRSATAASAPARQRLEEGTRWQKLKPAHREVLKPLQQEWPAIDAQRKQKWIELADLMQGFPAAERARIQTRMADWAKLTPAERGEARLHFEEAKQIPGADRRSRWEAYQALPLEEKKELAARAAQAQASPRAPLQSGTRGDARRAPPTSRDGAGQALSDGSWSKSNIVPNPSLAPRPRTVAPTVIQAAPGATTTLITRRPAPPPHQHTGLPKIAATPEFVDGATLLPQRGAQGAAVRPVPALGPVKP